MKKKRIFARTLTFILVLFTIWIFVGKFSVTVFAYESNEKVYSNATLKDDFVSDTVIITLTREATYRFHTYTPDDFPEVDSICVADLM